jgi:hypothetical protein
MDWSEVIQERLAAVSLVGGDVSEEALRRGWVLPFGEGQCTSEGDHQLSSFDIHQVNGEPLSSGCCGVRLNRLAVAFLFQHGFERSDWPDLVARETRATPDYAS